MTNLKDISRNPDDGTEECRDVIDLAPSELAIPGPRSVLSARLYVPAEADASARRLIVLFPPGGFISVEMEAVDPFLRSLAMRTGCAVLAPAYTTATVAPFPAAAEDAHAILDWVHRHPAELHWSGEQLIVAGIEAGGNLAAVSALMARDRKGPALAAQILAMPMLDPGLTSCSMRKLAGEQETLQAANVCALAYRGYLPHAVDRMHPYASPLQSSRMKGLPPALILSADDDPLRDEAELYGAKLIAAGIRASVRRLPPIKLKQPDARCCCARQEEALREICKFVSSLNS